MSAPSRQRFNPLDTLLLTTDHARRALDLPGGDIFLCCELGGHLDLVGLRRAIRSLRRRYPTIASRLVRGGWATAPYWDLAGQPRDEHDPVRLVECDDDQPAGPLLETMLAERINWTREPPLRCTLLRAERDTLVLRWPHFLTDGVGGVSLLDSLAAIYDEQRPPVEIESAGDERRDDFGTLTWTKPDWPWKPTGDSPPPTGHVLRLADAGPLRPARTTPRLILRRLRPDAAGRVRQAALGCCGFGRFADYLRATGIAVLDQMLRQRIDVADGIYTSFHLLDNRKRRDPGPVCHNVFSTLPLFVPATVAGDRSAVADLIQERTRLALTSDLLQRRLDRLAWLTRLPIPLLAGRIRRQWQAGPRPAGIGPGSPPSLPLGFMGPLPRPRAEFCGAPLDNLFGLIAPAPTAGFTVNVNAAQDRMNVALVHDPTRLSAENAEAFADRYVEMLEGR